MITGPSVALVLAVSILAALVHTLKTAKPGRNFTVSYMLILLGYYDFLNLSVFVLDPDRWSMR
jgi:hypothetical protein